MHSSDDHEINTSTTTVLFQAAIPSTSLTVPSTGSITTKFRSNSASRNSPLARKSRSRLSPFVLPLPKRSHLHKRKFACDSTARSLTPNSPARSNSSEATITTDHLTIPGYNPSLRSTSCSSSKQQSSIKDTLVGIWQGLNTNEQQSSPTNPKHFETRSKRVTPRWRAFAKVVAALLTFTRTKKGKYEWIQLVGHPGAFKEGIHDGYVLKELSENERKCCELLQDDALKEFVAKYNGTIKDKDGKVYIEMEDLLTSFREPCIMDCKIGVRTYLEGELDKSERDPKPRADLYNKMIAIDPSAPTAKENEEKQILKPRYMIWRESLSSTEDLGFRIEAIKKCHGLMSKDFQRTKDRHDVKKLFSDFLDNSLPRATSYLDRLIQLRSTCIRSKFIQTHELIGSSILFVHDDNKASLWMIDFGKTQLLPPDIHITHLKPWIRGSHEDGYLFGLDNLISIFEEIINELKL